MKTKRRRLAPIRAGSRVALRGLAKLAFPAPHQPVALPVGCRAECLVALLVVCPAALPVECRAEPLAECPAACLVGCPECLVWAAALAAVAGR